jgi:hypothetical protein
MAGEECIALFYVPRHAVVGEAESPLEPRRQDDLDHQNGRDDCIERVADPTSASGSSRAQASNSSRARASMATG